MKLLLNFISQSNDGEIKIREVKAGWFGINGDLVRGLVPSSRRIHRQDRDVVHEYSSMSSLNCCCFDQRSRVVDRSIRRHLE